MKKLIPLLLLLSGCSGQPAQPQLEWGTPELPQVRTIEEQIKYLTLKSECLEAKDDMDRDDIWLAHIGKTRETIPLRAKEFMPERLAYDQQEYRCRAYAEYMCLVFDKKNPVERCKNEQGMLEWK